MKKNASALILASLVALGCGKLSDNAASYLDDDKLPGGDGDGDGDGDGNGGIVIGDGDGDGGSGAGGNGTGGIGGGGSGGEEGCSPGVAASSQIPRLLNRQYDAVIEDLLGVTTIEGTSDRPSAVLVDDHSGYLDPFAWNAYRDMGERIAEQVMTGESRPLFISCDPSVDGCFEETIRSFGRKAFRRPLSEDEVDRFMTITQIEPAGTPEQGAEGILIAFLISPSFLMLTELSDEVEGTAYKLSNHEIATRLSFLLWGSIPDAELNAAADAGQLSTKEEIYAQAQRMISTREKTGSQVVAGHRFYVGMNEASHWWKVDHDPELFPDYSEAAKPVMQAEMDAFFEDVTFSQGEFKDLFLSQVGFINEDTAKLYGLKAEDFGAELEKVEFDDGSRPGFLTRLGFLSSFSNYAATSPILRGSFILRNILDINTGADHDLGQSPIPEEVYFTRREEITALTSPPVCSACHQAYNDPAGFVLENYDAIGAWQDTDQLGGPIDPIAEVFLSVDEVKVISTPLELMTEIAASRSAQHLYVEKWVSFATGRLPNSQDACTVDTLNLKLASGGYRILDLLLDLSQSDSLRLRTKEN